MRVILSAAGRAFLRDFIVTFAAFATGIFAAPNVHEAQALAVAASLASLTAAFRALRVFVPSISTGLAKLLRIPTAYAEVVITGLTTFLIGFLALANGVLSAPSYHDAKAAAIAGVLALGTALVRVVQAFLTPGEPGGGGITVPPQPVPPAALPPSLPN